MTRPLLSRWLVFAVGVSVVVLGHGRLASAQEPVRDVLSFLFTNQSVQTGDFVRDAEAARAARDTVSRALLVELTTLPISTSAGGFTYRVNPSLGTLERASDHFGGFFVDRAVTAGAGQLSAGATYHWQRFEALDGRSLMDGSLLVTANRFSDESRPFDVETLSLNIDTRTLTLFANYGLGNRLDIGAALPIIDLSLAGRRVDTYRGDSFLQASGSVSARGPGDVALRAKYAVVEGQALGMAAATDVRLPTGREEDLLGAGKAAVRVLAIVSSEHRPVAVHGNVGFGVGGLADEVDAAGAVTLAVTPRVTLSAELLGRRVESLGRSVEISAPHPTIPNVETIRLASDAASVGKAWAIVGWRWNVGGSWLVGGSVTLPLTDTGIRTGIVPLVSLDYAFTR